MRPENFNVHDVIDHLQGSCDMLDSCFGPDGILNQDFTPKYPDMTEDDLTSADYDQIDNAIFNCPSCGWWCEVGDWGVSPDTGEDVCTDCFQEQGGEEE